MSSLSFSPSVFIFLYMSVSVCDVCIYVCVCVCVCVCTMASMWRPEDNLKCQFSPSILFDSGCIVHHHMHQTSKPASFALILCFCQASPHTIWELDPCYLFLLSFFKIPLSCYIHI
jgi:hypothetical protein